MGLCLLWASECRSPSLIDHRAQLLCYSLPLFISLHYLINLSSDMHLKRHKVHFHCFIIRFIRRNRNVLTIVLFYLMYLLFDPKMTLLSFWLSPIWSTLWCHQDRIPFVVPERVPWKKMCVTLNRKFMSEVQTERCLDTYNQHFLAQKIFDNPDIPGDYSNMPVSWVQFNKVFCTCLCTNTHPHAFTNTFGTPILGYAHTDTFILAVNVLSRFYIAGSATRTTFHLLAMVWWGNGTVQETPEELLDRWVSGSNQTRT